MPQRCPAIALSIVLFAVAGDYSSALAKELDPAQWQEDLAFASSAIKTQHKNPFHFVTESEFDAAVAELDAAIPTLEEYEIRAGLRRIGAMIGDGHTWIDSHTNLATFPLSLYWFGDELRVRATRVEDSQYLGWKVVEIDGMDVHRAERLTDPYTAQAENDNWVRAWSWLWLVSADMMHAAGITKSREKVSYTLENDDGERRDWLIRPISDEARAKQEWAFVYDPAPIFMRRLDEKIWWDTLDNEQTLYLRFAGYPEWKQIRADAKAICKRITSGGIDTLIVDLRLNSGGNFNKGLHLIGKLKKTGIHTNGKVYVVTDRHTFSAAMSNASHFDQQLNAILVGEAPGERPNGYAESHGYTLPNSGIPGQVSIRYYTFADEDTAKMKMDKVIPLDFHPWKEGKDPVLDWILEDRRPAPGLRDCNNLAPAQS